MLKVLSSLKTRTERRNCNELNWHGLVLWNDQLASRASPLVIGWRVRERSHVVTVTACPLVSCEKLNHVSLVQFNYVPLYVH